MANLLDYLNENAAFQNLMQNQTMLKSEESAEGKEQEDTAIVGGLESFPLIAHVVSKGKEIYSASVDLLDKGKKAVSTLQKGATKLEEAAKGGLNKAEGAVSNAGEEIQAGAENIASDTLNTIKGAATNIASTVRGNVTEIGQSVASRMSQRAFEADPEEMLNNTAPESRDILSVARNVFRGTGKVPSEIPDAGELAGTARSIVGNVAENIGEGALNAAKSVATKVAAPVAEAVGETAATVGSVAAEAIPVVGELFGVGLGLYSLIHGLVDKPHPTPIYAAAQPVYAAGL